MIVCGYAIETPRLLLNSACPGFEQGLANSSGTVGKYLMAQAGNVILGRFAEPVRMYKAPPAHALTEEFYETDPKRGFARGFAIQTVGPLPIAFAPVPARDLGKGRAAGDALKRWQSGNGPERGAPDPRWSVTCVWGRRRSTDRLRPSG